MPEKTTVRLRNDAANWLNRRRRRPRHGSSPQPIVAVITDAIYPYHMGGKEVRYHHLIAGLAARDLDVHVFTMNWWKGPAHKTADGAHYHALCRLYPLYTSTRRSILEAVMFSIACTRLLTYRYDLIEADHMPHLQLFTIRLIAGLRRVPLMTTWHEYWGREYWREYLGPMGEVAAAIEQLSLRCSPYIVSPSEATAERLRAQGISPDRLAVVPNGIDLAALDAAPRGDDPYDVLYVGRLLDHKNVDKLVEAIAELRGEGLVRTLGIVGDGPERGRLEQLVLDRKLDEQVRFFGNVDTATEVFSLMKAASLFVLPSNREGFGIVVVEAMACGLPVITTNHADNQARHLVADEVNGWLCDDSVSSLAEKLRVAAEAELARPLLSPEAIAEYGWDGRVAKIYDLMMTQLHDRKVARA